MIFQDKTITLKDGRTALLRSPREEDIPAVLEYLRLTAVETPFLRRSPEECEKYTYEGEKELFENWGASEYDVGIACFVGGELAGLCNLTFRKSLKVRHRASVGIALIRRFWGLGIGTAMFEEMIRIAGEREEVLQMELDFLEGNARARALYEKMGFRIVGVHPNAIRLPDGRLLNEYHMIKTLDRQKQP